MGGLSCITRRSMPVLALANLVLLAFGCGHPGPESCYPDSSFADPALHGHHADTLGALSANSRPDGVVCELSSSGFRDLDQVLYLTRTPSRAIVRVAIPDEQPVTYEALLDENVAGMVERICAATVDGRRACVHSGVDGKWYKLRSITIRGESSAIAWSPRPHTDADSVLDVFSALRAYATPPTPIRQAALHTVISETYTAYQVLGLSQTQP